MKTIAIFSGYYLPHLGGVERYTYNLAKKLNKMGNRLIIVTSRYDKSLKEIEETEYAKIYRLPTAKISKISPNANGRPDAKKARVRKHSCL